MTWRTHATVGLSFGSFIFRSYSLIDIIICSTIVFLSSILPDCDHPKSKIMIIIKKFFLILIIALFYYIYKLYIKNQLNIFMIIYICIFTIYFIICTKSKHRGLTHSIKGFCYFSLLFIPLLSDIYLKFFMLGYASHLLADYITVYGIELFYPIKKRYGLKIFKTGSIQEHILGLICLTIYIINIAYRL